MPTSGEGLRGFDCFDFDAFWYRGVNSQFPGLPSDASPHEVKPHFSLATDAEPSLRLAVDLKLGGFVGSIGFVPTDSKGEQEARSRSRFDGTGRPGRCSPC